MLADHDHDHDHATTALAATIRERRGASSAPAKRSTAPVMIEVQSVSNTCRCHCCVEPWLDSLRRASRFVSYGSVSKWTNPSTAVYLLPRVAHTGPVFANWGKTGSVYAGFPDWDPHGAHGNHGTHSDKPSSSRWPCMGNITASALLTDTFGLSREYLAEAAYWDALFQYFPHIERLDLSRVPLKQVATLLACASRQCRQLQSLELLCGPSYAFEELGDRFPVMTTALCDAAATVRRRTTTTSHVRVSSLSGSPVP